MNKSMIVSGALFLAFMGVAGIYGCSNSPSAQLVPTASAAQAEVEMGGVALQQQAYDTWMQSAELKAARNGMDLLQINVD